MMKRQRWLPWFLVAASAILMTGVCTANERIRFKNGHTIVAISSRVEGEFIYLQMEDGSEVGFPRTLVAEREEGSYQRHARPTYGFGGRGPSAKETMAYRRNMVAARKMPMSLSSVARKVKGNGLNSVGFSYRGSGWGTANDASQRPRPLNILNPADGVGGSAAPPSGPSAVPSRGSQATTRPTAPPAKVRSITPKAIPDIPTRKGEQIDTSGKF